MFLLKTLIINIFLIILPLIIVCLYYFFIIKKKNINNVKTNNIITIAIFLLSIILPLVILIAKTIICSKDDSLVLLSNIISILMYVLLWTSGLNEDFQKIIVKIVNYNFLIIFAIKIIISTTIFYINIQFIHKFFVLEAIKYKDLNDLIIYYFIMIIIVVCLNCLIKFLKKFIKILEVFDCIDFVYIISLNTMLLVVTNNQVLYPILLFSITISVYADRKKIIKYYFGGQDEE